MTTAKQLSGFLALLSSILFSAVTNGASLYDDFDDNELDVQKWWIQTPTSAAGGNTGSVVEVNQRIEIFARGYLNSNREFDPSVAPIRIVGDWTFNDTADFLSTVTRSSGIPYGPYAEVETGVQVILSGQLGTDFQIRERVDGESTLLANLFVPVSTGDSFRVEVLDDGINITATISEIGGDGTTASLTAMSSLSPDVNLITFYNREHAFTAYLDNVEIEQIFDILGDMDFDDDVDFDDIDDFVLGLNNEGDYVDLYGVPPELHGDIDGDGTHDFDDIDDFVQILFSGEAGSAIAMVPEPAAVSLVGWGLLLLAGSHRRMRRTRSASTVL